MSAHNLAALSYVPHQGDAVNTPRMQTRHEAVGSSVATTRHMIVNADDGHNDSHIPAPDVVNPFSLAIRGTLVTQMIASHGLAQSISSVTDQRQAKQRTTDTITYIHD